MKYLFLLVAASLTVSGYRINAMQNYCKISTISRILVNHILERLKSLEHEVQNMPSFHKTEHGEYESIRYMIQIDKEVHDLNAKYEIASDSCEIQDCLEHLITNSQVKFY